MVAKQRMRRGGSALRGRLASEQRHRPTVVVVATQTCALLLGLASIFFSSHAQQSRSRHHRTGRTDIAIKYPLQKAMPITKNQTAGVSITKPSRLSTLPSCCWF